MNWIAGWSKRIKFTIDHTKVDEKLIDFPVLINLDSTCSGVFDELGNNSNRISFINFSSGEEYFCEIENWDSSNKSAQLWVKVPTIASDVDTEFYMFYDNNQANNDYYIGSYNSSNTYIRNIYKETGIYNRGALTEHATVVNDYIRLTEAVDSQAGYYTITDLNPTQSFLVTFLHYSGGGSGADEIKFSWDSTYYELSLDEYHDRVYLKENDTIVETATCNNIDNSTWSEVKIKVTHDSDYYYIKLWFRDVLYIDTNRPYRPFSSNKIRWMGRTGGENNEHRIKDLKIVFYQTPNRNVWDNSFEAVYHLSQDPSGNGICILDSTSYENHGTPNGSMSSSNLVNTIAGKGLEFDGVDDYIALPTNEHFKPNYITIEALCKTESTSDNSRIVDRSHHPDYGWDLNVSASGIVIGEARVTGNNLVNANISNNDVENDNTYHHVVCTYNGTKFKGYQDGILNQENTYSSAILIHEDSQEPRIAGGVYNNNYKGIISELRISNIARSSSWIKATNYSLKNQLLLKGQEEIQPIGALNYKNKIKIEIPHELIDSPLYNFPILLNLSENSGFNDANLSHIFTILKTTNNRKKIAVTDYTGIGQCYVEIEKWSQVEKSSQLWVKIPKISSSTSTILYLYYDIDAKDNFIFIGDTNSLPAKKVWNNNFVAVYHMAQEPSSAYSIVDSTNNTNNNDPRGAMTSQNLVDGFVGKATEFDGVDDYAKGYSERTLDNFSFECLCKTDKTHQIDTESNSGTAGTSGQKYIFSPDNLLSSAGAGLSVGTNGISVYEHSSAYLPPLAVYDNNIGTNFNHICIVYTSKTPSIFLNGLKVHTGLQSTKNVYSPITFGGHISYGYFGGIIDEVRLTNYPLPTTWIKATNYTLRDNFVYYYTDINTSWLETCVSGTSSPWAKRIKLEVDHTKVDKYLKHFPVLINLGNNSGYNNKDTNNIFDELTYNQRLKIAITKEDGTTQLPVEIEYWSTTYSGTPQAQLWTKVPLVEVTKPTTLCLYYDKTKSDNTDYIGDTSSIQAQKVWDDDFIAVYHMVQDPSTGGACILDSTANTKHGTPQGSMTSSDLVDGLVGKAIDFDGSDDGIDCGFNTNYQTITLEAMVKYKGSSSGRLEHVLTKNAYYATSHDDFPIRIAVPSTSSKISGTLDSGDDYNADITFKSNKSVTNTFTYAALTNNDTKSTFIVSNENEQIDTSVTLSQSSRNWFIGKASYPSSGGANINQFTGIIQEIRISDVSRSAEWLKTTDNSLRDNLIYYYNEETYTPPSEPKYYYQGYVKEHNHPVQRKVFLYDRSSGKLIDDTISDPSGFYSLVTSEYKDNFIVVLDNDAGDTYDPLIRDRLLPNTIP